MDTRPTVQKLKELKENIDDTYVKCVLDESIEHINYLEKRNHQLEISEQSSTHTSFNFLMLGIFSLAFIVAWILTRLGI